MSDQGDATSTIPGSVKEFAPLTEEHIQNLISYICNLSSVVIGANTQKVSALLSTYQNKNILKLFISKASNKIICLTKNEEKGKDPSQEYIFETKPIYKKFSNSTIMFIKRVPFIDCSKPKTIKKVLQMLNFTGGSNISMLNYIQNCIQSAFSPLFSSFQNTLRVDTKNNKTQNLKDVNTKMNDCYTFG